MSSWKGKFDRAKYYVPRVVKLNLIYHELSNSLAMKKREQNIKSIIPFSSTSANREAIVTKTTSLANQRPGPRTEFCFRLYRYLNRHSYNAAEENSKTVTVHQQDA